MSHHVIITDNILRNFNEIIELNPFDSKSLELIKQYDQKNKTDYSKYLVDAFHSSTYEQYELEKMVSPVFKGVYCNYDGEELKNVVLVEYETDLKKFKVYIDEKNYNIVNPLTSYVFNNLGMEQFVVFTNKNSKKIINELMEDEFIPLFDGNSNDSYVPLIKEKEDFVLSSNSVICV